MSCEQTTFFHVFVKMQRGKRLRLQTKEVVVNVYDYFKDLLKELLMPQEFHVPASFVKSFFFRTTAAL